MPAPPRPHAEAAARACLQDATPQSAQALTFVLEHWNGLTDTQRLRVYNLVAQLYQATAIRHATRALLDGGAR